MKKLNYDKYTATQLIDTRSQTSYQAGHPKGSFNLTPGNFTKYASHLLASDQPITFVIDSQDSPETLTELSQLAADLGFTQIKGYISFDEIPSEDLETIGTITAEEFLTLPVDDADKPFTLLDLRQAAEITRPAPDKNLTNIPLEELATDYPSLDPTKTIYTLCGSGNRATAAASFLVQHGYQPIVIEGGMKAVQALN